MDIEGRKKRNREFAQLLNAYGGQCQRLAETIFAMPTNPPLAECRKAVDALDALDTGLLKFIKENEDARAAADQADATPPVNNVGGPF